MEARSISDATKKNWIRLGKTSSEKLTKRANKTNSQKKIIPMEYFSEKTNNGFIENLLLLIESHNWAIKDVLYSISIFLLKNKTILEKKHVQEVLKEYNYTILPVTEYEIPTNEKDLLGIIYQASLSEGQKNIAGSYYTHKHIASSMTKNLDFSSEQTFLDPCCGSGAFLLAIENANPTQLYGFDIDPIAVMIAKMNLLLHYNTYEFTPQVFCQDYLTNNIELSSFNYIMTNPPWGVTHKEYSFQSEIVSKERFSLFFVKAFSQLKQQGIINFLFPESILNVKIHNDIRKFILTKTSFSNIIKYADSFTGVTTKSVSILCKKKLQNETIEQFFDNKKTIIPLEAFSLTKNNVFALLSEEDLSILLKIKKKKSFTLEGSIWALGIVTGDNKEKLKSTKNEDYERIYTGKEITPFLLKKEKNYIKYDRTQFQQVAKDEYYRANEKLVYKFISNKLVFAYDNSKSLFLNSANILIPNIPTMSIKTVLAFLNSDVFKFIYTKLFGEIKILKGNLEELPFPKITDVQNKKIESLVNNVLQGNSQDIEKIQTEIYSIFNISSNEITHIKECK